MGKKRKKKKETRLEKKLRKLANAGPADAGAGADGNDVELADSADAVVPAEVQLGGGALLGSMEPARPADGPDADRGSAEAPRTSADAAQAGGGDSAASSGGLTLIEGRPSFDLFVALQQRRTHKRFLARSVPRRALEVVLEAAVLAPNHKLTEPWGFVVLGERARRRYGEIRADAKLGRGDDTKADKRARIVDEVARIPAIVAVKMRVADDAVRREEDYAATFMAVQNLLLAATGIGLGTKVNTGEILDDDDLRELVGARRDERIVAMLNVGFPAESRDARSRTPATDCTTWLP